MRVEISMKAGFAFVLALWMLAPAAFAADARGVPWEQLSGEEQRLLKPFEQRWGGLAPERQERLRQGAQRWSSMTPEERSRAR